MRKNKTGSIINIRASPSSDVGDGIATNTRASPGSDDKTKHLNMVPMREVRISTWNIGTMTGRSAELSAILERRRINICCVQETKWKGAKSRQLGKGYKLYYMGKEASRNGVGVILDQHFSEKVIDINRISDRIISLKLALDRQPCLNIVSVYTPQVNCTEAEKQDFWEDLHSLMATIPATEQKFICGDLNGHVGKNRDEYDGCHGGFGFGKRNREGDTILDFATAHDLAIVNTYFKKKDEHLITFKSGNSKSQIDFFLVDRRYLKQIKDCKVIPGDPLTSQHRLLLAALKLRTPVKVKRPKIETIKWRELGTEKGENFIKSISTMLCEDSPQGGTPCSV